MKALVVGGTGELAETLRVILHVRWHELNLVHVPESQAALSALRREEPALMLVNLDHSVASCCDFISQVRACSDVPLVVVGEEEDVTAKVRALETGADDWILASSIPMEFIARVNALLRRVRTSAAMEEAKYANGALSIDFGSQEVRIDGRRASLTPTEFKVLCQLAKHEGTVVTREELLGHVWGVDAFADPEFVKKYVHRLRVKLEDDPAEPRYIVNRRGVGYMLAATSRSG